MDGRRNGNVMKAKKAKRLKGAFAKELRTFSSAVMKRKKNRKPSRTKRIDRNHRHRWTIVLDSSGSMQFQKKKRSLIHLISARIYFDSNSKLEASNLQVNEWKNSVCIDFRWPIFKKKEEVHLLNASFFSFNSK